MEKVLLTWGNLSKIPDVWINSQPRIRKSISVSLSSPSILDGVTKIIEISLNLCNFFEKEKLISYPLICLREFDNSPNSKQFCHSSCCCSCFLWSLRPSLWFEEQNFVIFNEIVMSFLRFINVLKNYSSQWKRVILFKADVMRICVGKNVSVHVLPRGQKWLGVQVLNFNFRGNFAILGPNLSQTWL